ncbi:hypothetical protein [Sphingomonas sp. IC081]|uniref:hypothetical protein n=1 Tax=Sphingomonas sp. IC081 TaxID=304378 RepID=UPI0011580C65|nr:hypothetical protein [Sphingomonas sp. IC081]QDK34554.1 hypothetical protein DM450_17590 [Sphingomonas sp. IC081]
MDKAFESEILEIAARYRAQAAEFPTLYPPRADDLGQHIRIRREVPLEWIAMAEILEKARPLPEPAALRRVLASFDYGVGEIAEDLCRRYDELSDFLTD